MRPVPSQIFDQAPAFPHACAHALFFHLILCCPSARRFIFSLDHKEMDMHGQLEVRKEPRHRCDLAHVLTFDKGVNHRVDTRDSLLCPCRLFAVIGVRQDMTGQLPQASQESCKRQTGSRRRRRRRKIQSVFACLHHLFSPSRLTLLRSLM
jgi:hypothetical protein